MSKNSRSSPSATASYEWLIAIPLIFVLAIFGSAFATFVWNSFLQSEGPGVAGELPTLENYRTIFGDTYYLHVLWQTFVLSLTVVIASTVISVPVSYCLARGSSRWVDIGIGIVLASVTMSLVVRALGWIGLLEAGGPVNAILVAVGVSRHAIRFIGNSSGVAIGLVHGFVPLMILTLLPVMQSINPALEDAAHGLGAGSVTTFRRIVLPLATPGIASGALVVFAMCMGSFTTPAILGGGKSVVFAELIQEQISVTLNYPVAAALSVFLVSIVLLLLWVGMHLTARRNRILVGA